LQPTEQQRGQVLVIVALSLLVLLAVVALAVDVGQFYQARRHMQNAADAGALAGAGELCYGTGEAVDAKETATTYAKINNGADDAFAAVSTDSITVTVVATKTVDTYFAALIGFPTADVTADASAICGPALSGAGLWPVAFDRSNFIDDVYADGVGCGKTFQIWTSDQIICNEDGNCDFNGDGVDDVVNGGDRGFLDFTAARYPFRDECDKGGGCGGDELKCRIRQEDTFLSLPVCIAGTSGTKASVADDVRLRAKHEDRVFIPLYDESVLCEPDKDGGCTNGRNYWVTHFACVRVVEWMQHVVVEGEEFPGVKAIVVRVDCSGECSTPYGEAIPRAAEPWELKTVSLTE